MTNKPFVFKEALEELEEITLWFESPEVDLDRGLEKFERGMELAAQLKKHLTEVENKVEKIKLRFDGSEVDAEVNPEAGNEANPDPNESEQTDLFTG